MTPKVIADLVHDLIDAELMLEQRRCVSNDTAQQRESFEIARQNLGQALGRTTSPQEQAMTGEIKAYLAALDDFERLRDAADSSEARAKAARQLEHAQHNLQVRLAESERKCSRNADYAGGERLLVPVDDSKESGWALKEAIWLSREISAEIQLLYVVPPVVVTGMEMAYVDECSQLGHQHGEELVNALKLKVPADIVCTTTVLDGDPATQIVTVARRWYATFIIMGTRGHSRFSRFFLGSTTDAVIRHASCPVLAVNHCPVHRSAKESLAPDESLVAFPN
ncbi:MAG: universal stress protein [Tepidisphaeraceae bacterium]